MAFPLLRSPEDVERFLDKNEGLDINDLVPLPHPYEDWKDEPISALTEEQRGRYEVGPDGVSATLTPVPETEEEREKKVAGFLEGLGKLLQKENNWTFLQPLLLSLDNCVKCQTCSESCPIYTAAGRPEQYRPTFRAETLRKIINRYVKPGGSIFPKLRGNDVELTWETVIELAELSYRCTLCRRCAQACPVGVDNALVTREIRKLFSQELGIHMPELHDVGTVKQLNTGSSTGLNPAGVKDIAEFTEEDIREKTGLDIKIPFDVEGADYLASEKIGYDSVNYGLFYDDVQLSRIAVRHYDIAKRLKAKRLLMGECGHAHKATMPIAGRVLPAELQVRSESALVLLEDIVMNDKVKLDPSRNDFPVTLHDPCNITRSMGIVQPQRNILKKICPQFREMEPHGVNNLCCGGGSGFAVGQNLNFPAWRTRVSGRLKFAQILEAFSDSIGPETKKYVCAPCSNCKGQMRDILTYYQGWDRCSILYGGLVELIVNAMVDVPEGFLEWEFH
jgi:Fe-S oxidoreductase